MNALIALTAVCLVWVGLVSGQPDKASSLLGFEAKEYCRRSIHWWTNTPVTLSPHTEDGVTTHYLGCYVRKPRSSRCTGGCHSFSEFVMSPWFSYRQGCDCCRAHRIQIVKPKVYCQVVVTICPWSVQFNVPIVSHPALSSVLQQHTYYLVDDCRCAPCNDKAIARRRRDVSASPSDLSRAGVPDELRRAISEVDESSVSELCPPPRAELTAEQIRAEEDFAIGLLSPGDRDRANTCRGDRE